MATVIAERKKRRAHRNTCGQCQGAGRITFYVHCHHGDEPRTVICNVCHGAGMTDAQRAATAAR